MPQNVPDLKPTGGSLRLPLFVLGGIVVLVLIETAWLSLARYQAYNIRAFDLGIMSQAIWSATQGQPLIFTIEGIALSRLARHVEIFYFALAPLYALVPDPRTLLVAQILLYLLGVIPLYRLARRRLENGWAAVLISTIYLFYPVAQTAVLFDLHGDTLAMPFLLFLIDALDRRAWRAYILWLVIALSCKFYVAGLIAGLGGLLWLRGQRRVGLITALAGMGWGLLAFFVIRPLFAPAEAAAVQATSSSYLSHYFGDLAAIGQTGLLRSIIALIVYLPVLPLGHRAFDWLLLAGIIAGPTLLSTGPGPSYDYRYHHYALAVPFLLTALVYGTESLRRRQQQNSGRRSFSPPWLFQLVLTLILTLIINSLFVDTPLNLQFYHPPPGSARGLDPSGYQVTDRDRLKNNWLAEVVPADAAVAADNLLAPHLVNRAILYLTRHPNPHPPKTLDQLLPNVDYVVVDSLFDFVVGNSESIILGGALYEIETISLVMRPEGFYLETDRDGLLLFGRTGPGLRQTVEVTPINNPPALQADFNNQIGLVEARITPLATHLYRLEYTWLRLNPSDNDHRFFAVTELIGIPQTRFVHLPTLALQPLQTWQPGQLIHETFDISLPANLPPGDYPLQVGWYDGDSIFAAQTDARSRLGDPVKVGTITIR